MSDAQQTREALSSWNQSLKFVEQQRRNQQVPAIYVSQMIKAARKALNEQRRQTAKNSRPPDAATRAAFDEIESRIQRLAQLEQHSADRGKGQEP